MSSTGCWAPPAWSPGTSRSPSAARSRRGCAAPTRSRSCSSATARHRRALLRSGESGAAVGAAAGARVREQRLRGVHAALGAHDDRARERRRRTVRLRARRGRRERRGGRVGRLRPLPRTGPRRPRADAARMPYAPAARPLRGRPGGLPRGAHRGRVAAEGSDPPVPAPRVHRRLDRRGGRRRDRARGRRGRRGGRTVREREPVPAARAGGPDDLHVTVTTYIKAINAALAEAMRADDRVFVLGEDVAEGGPYTATAGLAEAFGTERVRNTPISEAAITGVAVGAAQSGLRPVLEIMFIDFITLALDQVVNAAAKAHFMSGGQLSVPLVLRTQGGAGTRSGAQHSQSLEAWLTHVPGLKVVMPSGAADAAGLMASAIADPGPVVFVEHKGLYFRREDVPDEIEPVPIGRARVMREGSDVTIVALSRMVGEALAAAELLAEEGIEAEVIDPRTLVPLDLEAITESVRRTNRLVVAHEAVAHGGVGAEIAAQVQSAAFDYLDAPIERVGAPFTPIPVTPHLEDEWVPGSEDIYAAALATLGRVTPRRSTTHNGGGSKMRMDPWRRMRSVLAASVLAVAVAVSLGACGSGGDDSTSTSSTSAAAPADTTASSGSDTTASTGAVTPGNEDNFPDGEQKCGLGNGEKASGAPIKI